MRLYNYLLEENYDKEEIWDSLKNECSEYLYVLKDIGSKEKIIQYMLCRGTSNHYPKGGMTKVKPRKNRKPKDIPEDIHEILDELFEKKFGWPVRSQGVFATSNKRTAGSFGKGAFPLFPADGFKFVYSKTIDDILAELEILNIIVEINPYNWVIKTPGPFWGEENKEDVDWDSVRTNLKSIVEKYTDRNLVDGMRSRVEISFGCKYYYLIEEDMSHFIAEKLVNT